MPIDRHFLVDDEEVLADFRLHWAFLFGPLFLTLVALAVALAVVAEFPNAPVGIAWVLAVVVVPPCGWPAGCSGGTASAFS